MLGRLNRSNVHDITRHFIDDGIAVEIQVYVFNLLAIREKCVIVYVRDR
jgi:hypothetical protein